MYLKDISSILSICLSIRAMQTAWFAFNNTMYGQYSAFVIFLKIVTYTILFLGVVYFVVIQSSHYKIKIIYFSPIGFFLLLSLIHNQYNFNDFFNRVIKESLFIIIYLSLNNKYKAKTFDVLYWILQFNNFITCILCVFVFLKFQYIFESVPYYIPELRNHIVYLAWSVFAIFYNHTVDVYRACGLFNEPGGLGTLCALVFIARFRFMCLWEKCLLLLTMFFTASFAAFILITFFLSSYYISKHRKYIFLVFIPFFLWCIIPLVPWENSSMVQFAARLNILDDNPKVNTRTIQEWDVLYNNFLDSDEAWFGRGVGTRLLASGGESSYKRYIVQMGIIGTVIFFCAWGIAAYTVAENHKECLLLLTAFMMSVYQRPHALIALYGYVILFGGIEWIKKRSAYR